MTYPAPERGPIGFVEVTDEGRITRSNSTFQVFFHDTMRVNAKREDFATKVLLGLARGDHHTFEPLARSRYAEVNSFYTWDIDSDPKLVMHFAVDIEKSVRLRRPSRYFQFYCEGPVKYRRANVFRIWMSEISEFMHESETNFRVQAHLQDRMRGYMIDDESAAHSLSYNIHAQKGAIGGDFVYCRSFGRKMKGRFERRYNLVVFGDSAGASIVGAMEAQKISLLLRENSNNFSKIRRPIQNPAEYFLSDLHDDLVKQDSLGLDAVVLVTDREMERIYWANAGFPAYMVQKFGDFIIDLSGDSEGISNATSFGSRRRTHINSGDTVIGRGLFFVGLSDGVFESIIVSQTTESYKSFVPKIIEESFQNLPESEITYATR